MLRQEPSLRDTLANASLGAGLEESIPDQTADLHFKPGLDHRLPVRTAVGGAPQKRSFPTELGLPLPPPHRQLNMCQRQTV